jgi:hypothetical protein
MSYATRVRLLRIALAVAGVVSLSFYPLTILWPAGFIWHHGGPSPYLHMMIGIYATLGVFLLLAARSPEDHRSVIWFFVWSSVVHAAIMAVQAVIYPGQLAHLYGDVPLLFVAAVVLGVLMPRRNA